MSRKSISTHVHSKKTSYFNFLDVITAFTCLLILMSVVLKLNSTTQKASSFYEAEAEAIRIFDNVIVQLQGIKELNNKLIIKTFLYEYSSSSLYKSQKFKPETQSKNGRLILLVLKENGKPLAKLKI